jgi:SAM-dependent methyltransferase
MSARIAYKACPLCGGADMAETMVADCTGHPLYKPALPPRQRWMRCAACRHVFTDGYFTPEALAVLFSATQESQVPGYDAETQRYMWAKPLDAVQSLRAPPGRWLDVGYGNGALMMTAAEYGYAVTGLEVRADSVAKMKQLGFEAHAVELADFRPAEPFDVLSMADVLEHMPFPKPALVRARELLKPGGVLLLSMPNADAYLWRALNAARANPYWAELEHYHNFGRERLHALLRETGFEPLRYGVSERYRACMDVISRRP